MEVSVLLAIAALVGACAWKRSLVSAELIKITNHPFLYVALLIVLIGIPLSVELSLLLGDYKIGGYRPLNSFLVFGIGAGFGVKVVVFVILIFSALSIAGEFDKGTIKVILTRPVTRTEVFLAKCATMVLVAAGLLAIALATSLFWGLCRGELGPVWKEHVHDAYPYYPEMLRLLKLSIASAVLAVLATAFLGVFISMLTESSGHAVAVGLIFFLLLDLVASFLRKDQRLFLFNFYQGYGFSQLTEIASGSSATRWDDQIFHARHTALIPGVTSLVLGGISYVLFRLKNITA
jgi:ABC-type transport system involved in multi-copper enzyme maturation permease subunit